MGSLTRSACARGSLAALLLLIVVAAAGCANSGPPSTSDELEDRVIDAVVSNDMKSLSELTCEHVPGEDLPPAVKARLGVNGVGLSVLTEDERRGKAYYLLIEASLVPRDGAWCLSPDPPKEGA